MSSQKQIDANRRNARKSTGPRTEAGRAASRGNALTHGLTAKQIIAPGESEQDVTEFLLKMCADLAPVGPQEEALAEQIAMNHWRLRRIHRAEAELFARGSDGDDIAGAFQAMQKELATLQRYESTVNRSLQRARHDFERLQARRRGETVLAPIAVSVSGAVDINDPAAAAPESRRQDPKDPRQTILEFSRGAGDVNTASCAPLPSQSAAPSRDEAAA